MRVGILVAKRVRKAKMEVGDKRALDRPDDSWMAAGGSRSAQSIQVPELHFLNNAAARSPRIEGAMP